jgi:hypothetical protein
MAKDEDLDFTIALVPERGELEDGAQHRVEE